METFTIYFGTRRLILSPIADQKHMDPQTLVMAPAANGAPAKVWEIFLNNPEIQCLYVAPITDKAQAENILQYTTIIHAAGGLVREPGGKVLMIFRNGIWDLPKGKAEAGETSERTALREVTEETGASPLTLGRPIATTYHCYLGEDKAPLLKQTMWYSMSVPEACPLTPQREEEITQAVWLSPTEIANRKAQTYPSLLKVLDTLVGTNNSNQK